MHRGVFAFVVIAILAWCLIAFAQPAKAGEALLSWTKPEMNCNGTPLTDLAGFRVFYGQGEEKIDDSLVDTIQIKKLTPGTWLFGISAVTTAGVESYFTGPVVKEILPEEFVTTAEDVYVPVRRPDRYAFIRVGSAPLGTVCDATQPVGIYHVIPKASVSWSGLVRPDVVVAECG